LRVNEINFFDNWKEFSLKKPDEMILNHYDIVRNHTDINGYVKHKNPKEIIKVFSLFITHNYGSSIYELCNFLKYLNQINLSIYHVMVLDSHEIIKKIKKNDIINNQNISSKITLKIENHLFNISYSRISTYIVMLDFLEEFLGIEEILDIEEKIDKLLSYKDLKLISNNLSKKVYIYLKNLLPTSYIQSFSSAIGNQIIIEKKDENHLIVSEDISDDFILNFWINSKFIKKELLIKTFSLAADLCFIYKKSIDLNNSYNLTIVDQINDDEPWNFLSNEDVDDFMDQLIESSESIISNSINYMQSLHEKKINILKKNEINEIKIFSKYENASLNLSITILRISVFGNIQNKIIEAERRKKLNLKEDFFLLSNNLKYIDQKNIYEKLILNINSLKEIVFYKLWVFEVKETLEFIKDFLCENELYYFNKFLTEQKNKFNTAVDLMETDVSNFFSNKQINFSNLEKKFEYELEKLFINFKDFLKQENQITKFKEFNNYLDILKKQSKMFRRSGFEFNINNTENVKKLVKMYKSLNEINKFLSKLLIVLNSGIKKLDTQFNEDKTIFFQHFSYLYNNEEL
jgi:hypothetical protein|tara:strand:- start:1624 stop:3351 length:1728 start_codon:yes stop_codon:yes gene_type:complete